MKFSITLDGSDHTVELIQGSNLSCRIDGVVFDAEAALVQPGVYSLLVSGKSFQVRVSPVASLEGNTSESGNYSVQIDGAHYAISVRNPRRWTRAGAGLVHEGSQRIAAPMPGKVVRVLVAEQQAVEAGQGLVVVEAMKMQNEIKCPRAGTVQKVMVGEGQAVNAGDTLLVVE